MPHCRLIAMNLVSQIIICEYDLKPYKMSWCFEIVCKLNKILKSNFKIKYKRMFRLDNNLNKY